MYDGRIRQRIIHEITTNPGILNNGGAVAHTRRMSWRRRSGVLVSCYGLFMGIYLAHQAFDVYMSEEETSQPVKVFFPVFLGLNWPHQRRFEFPRYLEYLDPDHREVLADGREYMDTVRREDVQRQVLDCLFRSAVVRETFKLPISVKAQPGEGPEDFRVWIEPRHMTLHGPLFSIGKTDGRLSIAPSWRIKSVSWSSDINEFFSGLTSQIQSLAASEAQRNTHDKASGRIHQANEENDRLGDLFPTKQQPYNIAFSGTLDVSDLSKQHAGSVCYTGVIDNSHIGLNGGVRIVTLTLEVSEYGKSDTIYKLK
ncbi:hypothetical protein JCM33374_g6244 [Metschnikowia sp. JCM 33374]|nr:hypothetical protein JCM33374_g6244 [Metschnikowia sp. JCM 33374]